MMGKVIKADKFWMCILAVVCLNFKGNAQVAFGKSQAHPSAIMELYSATKGFLVPRVKLNKINDQTTILNPADGLLVFNTETTSDNGVLIHPGYYYQLNGKWVRLSDGNTWNLGGNTGIDPRKDFIGTSDDRDLFLKVFNNYAGWIDIAKRTTGLGVNSISPKQSNMGTDNVSIGYESMSGNLTGSFNSAIGYSTLRFNLSGSYNTSIGYQSLKGNVSGSKNLAVGAEILLSNSSGEGNIGIGTNSLTNNDTGNFNIAIGTTVMESNSSGSYNIVSGYTAGRYAHGNDNLTLGVSGFVNNKGDENVAIGSYVMFNNQTGRRNVALGFSTLSENKSDSLNTIAGFQSFGLNGSGSKNVGFGRNSGLDSKNSSKSIALGHDTEFDSGSNQNQLNIANHIFGLNLNTPNEPLQIGLNVIKPTSTLHVFGSFAGSLRNLSNAELLRESDYSVSLQGNALLPGATLANKGRIYNLFINANSGNYHVTLQSGNFLENGVESNVISLGDNGFSMLMLQSTGTHWLVLSKK